MDELQKTCYKCGFTGGESKFKRIIQNNLKNFQHFFQIFFELAPRGTYTQKFLGEVGPKAEANKRLDKGKPRGSFPP